MEEVIKQNRYAFPEPGLDMDAVTDTLAARVDAVRVEAIVSAADRDDVPSVVLPREVIGQASAALAVQASMLTRF